MQHISCRLLARTAGFCQVTPGRENNTWLFCFVSSRLLTVFSVRWKYYNIVCVFLFSTATFDWVEQPKRLTRLRHAENLLCSNQRVVILHRFCQELSGLRAKVHISQGKQERLSIPHRGPTLSLLNPGKSYGGKQKCALYTACCYMSHMIYRPLS